MPIDRPSSGDQPQEHDERTDQRQHHEQAEPVTPELPKKDWLEDARRVYGPIDENTPTWHGRDAEGHDITGSGRPDIPPEEVEAHHLAGRVREAAQIREGIEAGVRYGDDTLRWVEAVEAEAAAADAPEDSAEPVQQTGDVPEQAVATEEATGELAGHDDAVDVRNPPMPVDQDGRPAVRTDEYRAWYAMSGNRDVPVPYLYEFAEQVPDYTKALGTVGILVDGEGNEVWDKPQVSGYEGPAKSMELTLPRNGGWLRSHVEVHAVAEMWRRGLSDACLYVNRPPCPLDSPADSPQRRSLVNCDGQLEQILPPGSTLTVYGPDGWWKVYRGRPAEGGKHG